MKVENLFFYIFYDFFLLIRIPNTFIIKNQKRGIGRQISRECFFIGSLLGAELSFWLNRLGRLMVFAFQDVKQQVVICDNLLLIDKYGSISGLNPRQPGPIHQI